MFETRLLTRLNLRELKNLANFFPYSSQAKLWRLGKILRRDLQIAIVQKSATKYFVLEYYLAGA